MSTMNFDEVLNTDQAARFLKKKGKTLRVWRCTGKGPCFVKLPGGSILYLKEDLEVFLRNHRIDPRRAESDEEDAK